MRTIDIPDGQADLLEGDDLSNSDVKKIRRAGRPAMNIKLRLDEANAANGTSEEAANQSFISSLTDDELDDLDLFQRQCVVVCLNSWTLDRPLPTTPEEVDGLKPRSLYKALTTEAAKVDLSDNFGIEGASDPKVDTESSDS